MNIIFKCVVIFIFSLVYSDMIAFAEDITCIKEDFSDGSLGIFTKNCDGQNGFEIKNYADYPDIKQPNETNPYFFSTKNSGASCGLSESLDLKEHTEMFLSVYTKNTAILSPVVLIISDKNGTNVGMITVLIDNSKIWRLVKYEIPKNLQDVTLRIQCGELDPKTTFFAMDFIGIKAPDAFDCISDPVETTTLEPTTELTSPDSTTLDPTVPTTLESTTVETTTAETTTTETTTTETTTTETTTAKTTTIETTTPDTTTAETTTTETTTAETTTLDTTTEETTTTETTTEETTTAETTTLEITTVKSTTKKPTTVETTSSSMIPTDLTTASHSSTSDMTTEITTSTLSSTSDLNSTKKLTTSDPVRPNTTTESSGNNTAPPGGQDSDTIELWQILSIVALAIAVLSLSFTAGVIMYFFLKGRSKTSQEEVLPTISPSSSTTDILPRLEIKKGVSENGEIIFDITGKKNI